MNQDVKTILSKIEALGWRVSNDGENEYMIGKFSARGQDFNIFVSGETAEELVDSIYEAYENYDVSTETYLWLDNSGHGINGAPYDMRDVLEDMESCEQAILDLHTEISKEL